jgi:histidyl-tRNA synthetase
VVLLGDDEMSAGRATLRDLLAGEQTTVGREELAGRIKESA